jgi:hypothetical protein
MLKKIFISVFLFAGVLVSPATLHAKTVCTQDYGQPVKCVEEEEPVLGVHVPVETGLAENLMAASGISIAASGVLFYISKRTKSPLPTD